jgi:hypothetical protein
MAGGPDGGGTRCQHDWEHVGSPQTSWGLVGVCRKCSARRYDDPSRQRSGEADSFHPGPFQVRWEGHQARELRTVTDAPGPRGERRRSWTYGAQVTVDTPAW